MESVAQALYDRFDDVCRSELQRLRKKTATLTAAQRAEVDALAAQVMRGIAARTVEALIVHEDRPELGRVVARLFGADRHDETA